MAARRLPAGTKIRVNLTVRTASGKPPADGTTFSTLTPVRETVSYWNHFLYLESPHITRNDEGTITAAFDAVVASPAGGERNATTKIHADGCTHFVYLGSSGITVIEDETAEEEKKTVPGSDYATGDEIQVALSGKTGGDGRESLTTEVTEAGGAFTHYLYLVSPQVTRRPEPPGDTVTAAFRARITGTPGSGKNNTTRVTEIRDGRDGFSHYVYLDSSAVTRVPAEEKAEEEAEEAAMIPARDVITSGDVTARIAELSGRQQYEVVRARNGEVLKNCADEATAAQFITDEDYDPARVVVRRQGLDAAGERELGLLRRLSADLTGVADGWTVYRESYFSGGWARLEATGVLGTAAGEADQWPLNLVDWSNAAVERQADRYRLAGNYGGTDFYIAK